MSVIAARYAKAIFQICLESQSLDSVSKDFSSLKNLFEVSKELQNFLVNPLVSRDSARQVVSQISRSASFSETTRNFLEFLAEQKRLGLLRDIIQAFDEKREQYQGLVRANVTSSCEMTEQQSQDLAKKISDLVGARVKLQSVVDPEILGGLVVRFGPFLIDSSLRSTLNKMQNMLKGA